MKITSVGQDKVTITGNPDFKMTLAVKKPEPIKDADGNITGYPSVECATAAKPLTIDVTGIGSMDMQTGANEGQQLAIRIPTISSTVWALNRPRWTRMNTATKRLQRLKAPSCMYRMPAAGLEHTRTVWSIPLVIWISQRKI